MRQESFLGGIAQTWRMRILAILLAFVSGACALAQGGGNVAIGGVVMDPTGAAIANAKITVTQKSTSVAHTSTTSAGGQFNITSLPPSTYTVTLTLDIIRSASDRGQQGGPGGVSPDMKTFGSTIFQLPTAQSGMRSFAVSGDFT